MTKEIIRPLLVVGLITYLGFNYYLENYPETKLNNSVNEQNNEILDVKITKIEKVNKGINSLAQHDYDVNFLYDNMDCNTDMSFNFKKTYISSNAFFCKGTSGYTEFYSEFPMMNAKYEYIIIDKTTGIKISDLNSVDISKLSIQKNLVQ